MINSSHKDRPQPVHIFDAGYRDLFRENQLGFAGAGGIFALAPSGEVCW
jgi:hypothetical protein